MGTTHCRRALVFGTPIAGSIFGVEVLFVGAILYEVLLPSFIAGITAYHISSALGIRYFYHPVKVVPVFTEGFFLQVILAGVFFGLCSMLLIETMKAGGRLSARLRVWDPLKGVLGGAALVVLALVFSTRYLGLGLETVESCLGGTRVPWYAFMLKPLFTSITLNFGGSGGIVTPIFFVGATSGPAIAPYATVACVISFLMTGHRSVYPSQVLSITKSESLQVELGREMEQIEARFTPRSKGLVTRILLWFRVLERTLKQHSS